MIEEACIAIESVEARDRRLREAKYARRNRMRYIDHLLNELEMLNLAERRELPQPISGAVARLLADLPGGGVACRPGSVIEAMDLLYEIQDGLMFTSPDED
ncbi:MAG: hypothetical protein M3O95_11410 [Candidatus Dormibacteraeota bacterium]|jgi:hypothetical protein|nr:hypothetical protein [Candidatus Dormibacteraeota bacterium]MDQ6789923.1 hypothetical protein [Candidatus Dormibacteraeota bacterium]